MGYSHTGLETYEIWFRTSSSFQYRKWVDRYLVMPPFTNHSDAPEHDSEAHGNHKEPKIEDVAKYEPFCRNAFN